MKVTKEVQLAYEKAIAAREMSYSPYSKFKVGACLKIKNKDQYVGGCNIENASYGGTICAERSAIHKQVSEYGVDEIEFMVIVADTQELTAPCGICRQVMSEFFKSETPVYLGNLDGVKKSWSFGEILPFPFNKESLLKN